MITSDDVAVIEKQSKDYWQRQLASIMRRTKTPGWAYCTAALYAALLKDNCLNDFGIEHMRGFLGRMGE